MAVNIHNDLLFFIQCQESIENVRIGQPADLNKYPIETEVLLFTFFIPYCNSRKELIPCLLYTSDAADE